MPQFRTPSGQIVFVSDDQVTHALDQGYKPVSVEETAQQVTAPEDNQGGIAGGVIAGATSLASGATLGLSDVALGGILNKGDLEQVRQARNDHPIVSGVGSVLGATVPAFVAPESLLGRTPAGFLARAGSEAIEGAKAVGGLKAFAGVTAISGAEGSLQSAGMYLSDVALGDRDLTAEGLKGALGRGFAFGAVPGGAMFGLEKGTMAARRMFARVAEGGETAATDATATFDRKLDEVMTAHDDAAAVARKRLDEIQGLKREAERAKARANAELAQSKLEAFQQKGAPPVEEPAGVPTPEAPQGPAPTPQVPEAAGPSGETQVSQTSSARPAATGTLEDQLAATKAGLDQGATLQDLNAARAARGTTVTNPDALHPLGPEIAAEERKLTDALDSYEARRAKVDEWVARIKNPRTKLDTEATAESIGSGQAPAIRGRTTRALDEDVFVEQSGGNLRTIGKGEHSLEDITPNSRILARSNGESFSKGAQLDEMYQDAVERASLAETEAEREAALHEAADVEQQIHKYVRTTKPENGAVIDKIEEVRGAAGRTGYHAAFARAERRAEALADAAPGKLGKVDAEAEQAYQDTLAGRNARTPIRASFLKDAEEQGFAARAKMIAEQRAAKGLPPLSQDALDQVVRPQGHLAEVAEGADVLGGYEKAAADLVDAIGPAAPPAAQEAAQGYRAAEDEVQRKVIDRTTRAIDDHAEQYGPYEKIKPAGRNPVERAASAKQIKLEADAQLTKLKVEEGDLRSKLPASKPTTKASTKLSREVEAPKIAPTAKHPILNVLDKAGQALEVANMAGIPGVPKPSDIPVIGPLLGMFLKFRALTGKIAGRVEATADSKVAALAAKTRDRAARAVDRMLGLAESAAPAARTASIATTTRVGTVLAKRFFDDGHPDAPKDASVPELAAVRIREIGAAASNPSALIAHVRTQLKDVSDPDLIASAEQLAVRTAQYLADQMPKLAEPNVLTRKQPLPSAYEATRLARMLEIVDDPVAAFEQVEQKCLTPEAAQTLRAVSPKIFAEAQQRLISRATEIEHDIPYEQRIRMSLLYDVALDRSLEPATIASLQTAHQLRSSSTRPETPTQNAPPTPSVAGPVNLASIYTLPGDRRAARR